MRIFVVRESKEGEKRVALVPDIIAKVIRSGLEVSIESGAGAGAEFSDEQYKAVGATIVGSDQISSADVVVSIQPLSSSQMSTLKKGAITLSFLAPSAYGENIDAAASAGLTSFSMELIPRISRAQSMDALTSQALCAGYRCALVAAELSPKFFPLLMTAAGTVTPANVVVLGAGVAGLQAIATAKRLGAVVSAYDVRPSSADEVKSMGAKFITLELETLEAAGGYARAMDEDRAAKQRELLTPYITAADVVITTAAVPGRAAPRLLTADMVTTMAPGSVVVDLAAESGGNVEGSIAGETVVVGKGVKLWGAKDVASQIPFHASMLYSRNIVNLLTLMNKDGVITPDFTDEIIDAACVAHGGARRSPELKK
jgi:NAD(P) transhydrogenase subunit alpha